MTVMTKLKSIAGNWREVCQNYIGSLGYYLLFLSIAMIIIKLYMQLSQYVIYSRAFRGIDISSDAAIGASYQPGFLEGLAVYGLSLTVILVSLAVILALPYAFGYVFSKFVRMILEMTNLKLKFKNLFKLKYSFCLIVATVVLLVIYDYSLSVDGNWYGLTLLGLSFIALVLFWIQSLLVKFWKIKIDKVY